MEFTREVQKKKRRTELPSYCAVVSWGALDGLQVYRHIDSFSPEAATECPETTEQGLGQQNPRTNILGLLAALSFPFPSCTVQMLSSSKVFPDMEKQVKY